MTDKPIRPGKVADILGVSGMTVRNYVREFSKYLSPLATADTARKFTPEDVKTLQFAASLLRDGESYENVRQALENKPQIAEILDQEPEPEPEEPEPVYQESAGAIQSIEFFTRVIDTLNQEHQTALEAKDALIDELRRDKTRLQEQLDRLAGETESQRRRSWWDRLFGRKDQ